MGPRAQWKRHYSDAKQTSGAFKLNLISSSNPAFVKILPSVAEREHGQLSLQASLFYPLELNVNRLIWKSTQPETSSNRKNAEL